MANSTLRQELIFNLQKKLFSLSRDQLQVIASLIDDSPANNVDVLSVPELYNLIVDFIRSEKLSSLEDEGMTQLLLLDDLISDLLAFNGGAAGNDPTTPLRTHDASASQSGCPNPIYSDRESAPPDTNIPLQPTQTASNVSTQSPAHLDSDTHTHMSHTDRDGSPARAAAAATPAESSKERENDHQKQQDPPAQGSAEMVGQSPAGSPSGSGKRNFLGKYFLAGSAVLGGIGAVALAPVVLGAVGFTSAGIAAGSYAASMMSAAAVANGGGVAAGSLVAVLQSAGAVGLSAAASTAVAGVGAGIGATAGLLAGSTNNQEEVNKEDKEKKDKDEKSEEEDESEGENKKK